MKTLLYVFVPESTEPLMLNDAVDTLLEPHRLKDEDNIQDDWRFDYLCRFEPTLNCSETDAELPREIHDAYAGYVSRLSRIKRDSLPGAVITPNGQWHDLYDFGFRMLNDERSNTIAKQKWQHRFWELVKQSPDCWVIETWVHS